MIDPAITTEIILRPARLEDALGIAHVHVNSWLSTYRGILPDHLLDQLSIEQRQANWQGWLSHETETWTWVADDPVAGVVGFVCGGSERTESDFSGEVYALYLLAQYQHRGIGKRLLHKGFELLQAQNHSRILIWVASLNHKACQFYLSQGGQASLERSLEMGGEMLSETGYTWLIQG
jgi:ribosomal protein S18 acetylase RimI-like enzyme